MHSHGHSHKGATGSEGNGTLPGKGRRLLIALALNLGITVAEVIGGIVSGSLALLADAAHNASDAGSVLISYIAYRIAQRPADRKRSFGFGRAETVGALINLTTLLAIGVYLLIEAGNRLYAGEQELAGRTMLIVGVIALVEDLLAAWVLRRDLGSLNVKSTYLHMIADALATVGVIIAGVAVLIWGPSVSWIDPAATALIALYIFWHGGREIRKTIAVLIDTAPPGFDHDGLLAKLERTPGVREVHHIHVWQREEGRTALEAHLVLEETDLQRATELKERLKGKLRDEFEIAHSIIEIEVGGAINHDRGVVPQC